MERDSKAAGLPAALGADLAAVLDRATQLYEASSVRLPGRCDTEDARQVIAPFLQALAEAMPLERLTPGSAELRELEKAVTFAASRWASDRSSGFDLVGMLLSSRNALLERATEDETRELLHLFDWLSALACDAYGDGGVRAEKERMREALERGMPVTLITPDMPAAFLIGEPDSYTLDGVFGRLAMLIVRVGARAAIVDANGMSAGAAPAAIISLDRFLRHRKLADVTIFAIGLSSEAESSWSDVARRAGVSLEIAPSFERALRNGMELTEHRLVRRPSS